MQKIGNGTSKFTFEFNLNPQEIVELKDSLKLSKLILSENLRILVEINEDNEISYKAFKKSRLNKWEKSSLSDKTTIGICFFIGRKIDFTYIPAIRASNAAIDVVKSMVERELLTLEENADYSQALKTIEDLQKPILDKISQKITQPLREFIPQIKSVEIEISSDERRKALTGCKIIIDDGTPTPIERKGDGIKSLAVISLLRKSIVDKKISILALEEPESHLHPSAIHRLKGVIDEIACSHQVILTTHCPLFVNRVNIKNNIIISNNEAKPAKNINEIRDILGVRASDNLMHAKLVLVVEGDCDKIILESLFLFTLIS
ncbi:ATP-binding protein [Synechocystis sp. B12]|nr:ATP-binding protein [Synechocystis sp. B12]